MASLILLGMIVLVITAVCLYELTRSDDVD